MISTNRINRIIKAATTCNGYREAIKAEFHRDAAAYLRELATLLGLAAGTYDVRSNKGGVAVLGEVTLHGEHIYLQLGGSIPMPQLMYRSCKSRKDYSGGPNCWAAYTKLQNMEEFAASLKRQLAL